MRTCRPRPSAPDWAAPQLLHRTLLTVALAIPAGATEWYVDASASCAAGVGSAAAPFCTIGEAVAAAVDGDTVLISPGNYTEALVLTEDLTLVGTEGRTVTFLDAGGQGTEAISVLDGAMVSITGLEIRNADFGRYGIRIANATPPAWVVLTNTTIRGNGNSGLANVGGTVLLKNSILRDNDAYNYGGGVWSSGFLTVHGCLITNNEACSRGHAGGGGIFSSGTLTVLDSAIDDNAAIGGSSVFGGFDSGFGGGIYNARGGVAVLRNSSVSGNSAGILSSYIALSASGGGLFNKGDLTVEGCLVAGNTTFPFGGYSYYYGGNARAIDSPIGTLELRSSTVAGSYDGRSSLHAVRATPGSEISDTIVWGNDLPLTLAPQIQGVSSGQPRVHHSNVQGDWSGPGAFNLNEDPRFTNPAAGDYTLRSTSGLIDRGDPDSALLGLDLGGGSRQNDGDLDRSLILDMGAFELSHVRLDVTGDARPGGELTVTVSGKSGMSLLLAIGPPSAGARLDPFGILFFDLGAPVKVVSFGTIPATTTLTIPPTVVGPVSVVMQLLALDAPGPNGKRAGNVSNPFFLTVR